MARSEKKIKKTIWLTPSTLQLVEGYSGVFKEDFSNSVESLIIRGLENIDTANDLKKIVYSELKKLKEENKKLADRLANLSIGNTRFLGRLYAHTFKTYQSISEKSGEEIKELEKQGTTKALQELRTKKEADYEEE